MKHVSDTRRHRETMTQWQESSSKRNKTSRKLTLHPSPVLKPSLWPRYPEWGILSLVGKKRHNPTPQELNFKYMTYFYIPTKIRARRQANGTSIKRVSLLCHFIFPSVSGLLFTRSCEPNRHETSPNSWNTLVTPVGTVRKWINGGQVPRNGIKHPENSRWIPVPY